jgi:hypothetical protein
MKSAETLILEECLELLRRKVPLEAWPAEVRNAFLAALDAESGSPPERQKARDLRRHLFRDRPLPMEPIIDRTTAAERVRADLIALVPLGAGLHLAGRTR